MGTDSQRLSALETFSDLADRLQHDVGWVYSLLRSVSPGATASDEVSKTIRALRTYSKELPGLEGRVSRGTVAVALPFNNPLYSLVLYAFGPLLGGSEVLVRPSSITARIVSAVFERYRTVLRFLPLTLVTSPGSEFLTNVAENESVASLLFTGSYSNLLSVETMLPEDRTLIYCGSGIDPFIVTPDAFSGPGGAGKIVDLAIRSKLHNSGQDCLCAERFYVHRDLFPEFIGQLTEKVRRVKTGPFEDETADVVPLLGGLASRLRSLMSSAAPLKAHLEGAQSGDLVSPSIVEVALESPLLTTEKFGPAFVIAQYDSPRDLDEVLEFDYRFGATVCGSSYTSPVLDTYPHTTANTSVVEVESEDAHIPFGGRLRSGFVRSLEGRRDGPILYSIETTEQPA